MVNIMSAQLPMYSGCLQVEDKNVFKLFVAVRKMGPVARALGSIVRLLNKCGSESVEQYCKETLKYSSKSYEKAFNKEERDLLESSVPWEELDITLLHKLLQQICELAPRGNVKWTSQTDDPDCLEYSLTKLKNVRNHVVHNLVSVSDNELVNFFTDIIKLMKNVFLKVGEKLEKDLTLESGVATKELQSLLTSPLPLSNIQEYQQSLEETRKALIEVTLSEGRKELCNLYTDAWVVSSIPWSSESICKEMEIDKVYTSLQLETSSTVDIEKVLVLQLNDGSTPHVICVSGIAGAGKTSICSYLLYSWCQDPVLIEGMGAVDFLFLIQCRHVNYKLLVDYIRNEYLPNACGKLEYSDISPVLRKCKNLFIFDGFDEAGPEAQQLFQEAVSWPAQTRVIVTSRPEFMKHAMELLTINPSTRGSIVLTVNISGFEEARKKEYIHKLFSVLVIDESERTSKMNAFLTYLDDIEKTIGSSLQLPLTLSLIVFLWLEDESKVYCVQTVTTLYLQLIRLNLHRLAKRLQQGSSKHFDEILNECYNRFLIELSREAYFQLRKFHLYIDEKGVERIQKTCSPDIDTTQALSSLLHYEKPVVQTDARKCWVFPHKTFQEVLAGYFVHNCYKENMIPPGFETTPENRPHGLTLIHAIGLMHLQKPEPDHMNMKKVADLLGIIYGDRNDTVNSFYVSGLILKETEGSLIGREIAKKLISYHSIPEEIVSCHMSLEQLLTVLQYIDVSFPKEICLRYTGSHTSYLSGIIAVLKKQNVIFNLICCGNKIDLRPEIFNEFMGCNTINLGYSCGIDSIRQIGEIWASQIRNKAEASIEIIIKNYDVEVKIMGEQIPHIVFSFVAELFDNFFLGVQKGGISCQKGTLRFVDNLSLLDDRNIQTISSIISQFPFTLPEIIALDSACISVAFVFFAQKVKDRCSSLKIKSAHISSCNNVFHLQNLFDVSCCMLTVNMTEKDVGKPIQSLAHTWVKWFISQSGSGNAVYDIGIDQYEENLEISVIVSGLKEYKTISVTTNFHQEGNIPLLNKSASMIVSEVEKAGIMKGGQTACNLMFSFGFCYSAELMNFIEIWSPTHGKGMIEGEVAVMATARLNGEIASLVEYLDSRGFERDELPLIEVRNSESLQILTENLYIAIRLYKECGLTLDLSVGHHLCPVATQKFCQRWVSAIGSSHKVRLHLSCFGHSFDDSIRLSVEVQTCDSFHFLTMQQRRPGKDLVMVITALLKELEKASVPVHDGQMSVGVLTVNFMQLEIIADLLSVLSFSIKEPVVVRGPIHTNDFKRMCKCISENGSSVHLRGISVVMSKDLYDLFPNMEWIRNMLLDQKLELGLHFIDSGAHIETFAQGWAERLPHVGSCALKLICECSSEAVSFIFSIQLEETTEVLELYSVNQSQCYTLLEACPSFLKGFQKAGGNLSLGQFEIIASDLMKFDTHEFIRFLYNISLKLCQVTEFTRVLMDVSLLSLMNQVKDKGSEMRISDCLVLNSKSLPLVCKYMRSVRNMFLNDDLVFELQKGEIPKILDFELFGCKWLESEVPLSVTLTVTCCIDMVQIACSTEEAPLVPNITWRQKFIQDGFDGDFDGGCCKDEDWSAILEILIPFLKGIQTVGVKVEDCHLVFEEIAVLKFSHSFANKLQSIPATLEKFIHIHDVVADAEFITLLDFLASQGSQIRITGALIFTTQDSLMLFAKEYIKIQRIFPDHVLKFCVTEIDYIFDETLELLVHMWLGPLQSQGGSEKLEVKLTTKDKEMSLECSISNTEKIPKFIWLADSQSCRVMVWAKILASFIDHVKFAGITVKKLDYGRIDLVFLTPLLLMKIIDILPLEKQAVMNFGTVKISRVVIDLIKTMSVKVDCFLVDNDVNFVVLTKDFADICKTLKESKFVLYLNLEEFTRKLPVYILGKKWASDSKVLTDTKVIVEFTCEGEEISVNCSLGNSLMPDIQWKTNSENIEVIGEVIKIFFEGVRDSGVEDVVLSLCHIDHMNFADEFVNSLLKKIKAEIICKVEIKSIEINEDSKTLLNYVKSENCLLRISSDYEIECVHNISHFDEDFRKWLKCSGGSRIMVFVTFSFFNDVEPLKKLGHTWVTSLIFPRANKLDVHLSHEEGVISLELKVCGPEPGDIPAFVWKTYQGNGKILANVVNYFLEGVNVVGVPIQEGVLRYSRDLIMSLPADELRNLIRTLNLRTAD